MLKIIRIKKKKSKGEKKIIQKFLLASFAFNMNYILVGIKQLCCNYPNLIETFFEMQYKKYIKNKSFYLVNNIIRVWIFK